VESPIFSPKLHKHHYLLGWIRLCPASVRRVKSAYCGAYGRNQSFPVSKTQRVGQNLDLLPDPVLRVGHTVQPAVVKADRSGKKTSILCPVADVIPRRVVVPAVHLSYPRSVEVHRDRRALARVPYLMDAPVARQYARGPVLWAPPQLPGLLQAGVVGHGAVVEALVAFLEHGAPGAAVDAPGGVIVDLGPCSRRPHEDFQGVGAVLAVVAAGYIPLLRPCASCRRGTISDSTKAGSSTTTVRKGAALCRANSVGSPEISCSSFACGVRDVVVIGFSFSRRWATHP
jgi:hypothetical protein